MKNIPYLLALQSVSGLGPIRLKAVLDYFKDPKLAWEADSATLKKIGIPQNTLELLTQIRKRLDPQKYMEDILRLGIKWVSIYDDIYPRLLRQIYDPPVVMYYRGNLGYRKGLAVVGSRKITGYGRTV